MTQPSSPARRFRLGFLTHVQGPGDDLTRTYRDILSGGRVETGVGSGGSEAEYAAFGRDLARKRELSTEGLRIPRGALANEEVGAPGFTIQPLAVSASAARFPRTWTPMRHRGGSMPSTATRTRSWPD